MKRTRNPLLWAIAVVLVSWPVSCGRIDFELSDEDQSVLDTNTSSDIDTDSDTDTDTDSDTDTDADANTDADTEKDISDFSILGIDGSIDANTITLTVPCNTDLTSLTPTITHTGESVSPPSGATRDFTILSITPLPRKTAALTYTR